MGIVNSSNHNYRRHLSESPIPDIILSGGDAAPTYYGYINDLQSSNLSYPTTYRAIIYTNDSGDIVSVGRGITVSGTPLRMYVSSDNGQTYTFDSYFISSTFSSGLTTGIKSLAKSGSHYSALLDENALYSSDGSTWQVSYTFSSTTSPWSAQKVIWVENGPTLGGTNSYFYYMFCGASSSISTDGQNFTFVNTTLAGGGGLLGCVDVIWCSGLNLFIRVGSSRNNGLVPKIHWSEDGENYYGVTGITWTYNNWASAAYSPELNRVVCVGLYNNDGYDYNVYIAYSDDGKSFTQYLAPNAFQGGGGDTADNKSALITWSSKYQLFFLTQRNTLTTSILYTSSDGINWIIRDTGLTVNTTRQFNIWEGI
jgi:hypothetical protein